MAHTKKELVVMFSCPICSDSYVKPSNEELLLAFKERRPEVLLRCKSCELEWFVPLIPIEDIEREEST